jgi:hypothetical protein
MTMAPNNVKCVSGSDAERERDVEAMHPDVAAGGRVGLPTVQQFACKTLEEADGIAWQFAIQLKFNTGRIICVHI